jgi:hypothetical protein
MSVPATRVQVLMRPKVLELVKVLAEEENLTLSKVCSQLVEAGLIAKGIIDPTPTSLMLREPKTPPPQLRQVEREASPSVRSILGVDVPYASSANAAKADNYNMTTTRKTTDLSTEDLELLQKLKALKSVGLL